MSWKTVGFACLVAFFLCSLNTQAMAQDIKIGTLFVMSGKLGGYGKSGWQATEMAVDEINKAGGILGRKVVALNEDEQARPEIGVQIVKKYITKEKVDFIVGPTASSVGVAVSDVCRQYKKLMVSTQSATGEITDEEHLHRYVFQPLNTTVHEGYSAAAMFADKPYKRWMCIGPDYSYGYTSWKAFRDRLKEYRSDVEFVGELWPKLLTADYTPYINKIMEAKPDAVLCSLWGGDAVTFLKQAIPFGLFGKTKFAFVVGASMEVLEPLGKEMPDGIYMSARYFFTTPRSEMNRKFVESYRKRYNEYPSYMAEETYAGIYFLKAAIERAGTTDTEKIIDGLEREPLAWEAPEGWKIMRPEDHGIIEGVVWGQTAFSKEHGFSILKDIFYAQPVESSRTTAEAKKIRERFKERQKK